MPSTCVRHGQVRARDEIDQGRCNAPAHPGTAIERELPASDDGLERRGPMKKTIGRYENACDRQCWIGPV